MPEITDLKSLEAWLQGRPREDAVVIAARTALRVAPFLSGARTSDRSDPLNAIVLLSLRAKATAWVAAAGPTRAAEVREAATVALRAFAPSVGITATEAAVVAASTRAVASRAATATSTTTPAAAGRVAGRAGRVAGDAAVAFWSAVSADATKLQNGTVAEHLARLPLWQDRQAPGIVRERWRSLRDRLLDADTSWRVWTDWYQDRLDGASFNKTLEEARVIDVTADAWRDGWRAVNARIAELIKEHSRSVRPAVAQRISQQPRTAAEIADRERATLEQRIEELRASLPNDPEGLEGAQSEIELLKTMKRSLETVTVEARSLPENASPADAEVAAEAVEDLAAQLKNWASSYLTKERADATADALVVAGLIGLLTRMNMPAWLAGGWLIARFSRNDVFERVKAILMEREQ